MHTNTYLGQRQEFTPYQKCRKNLQTLITGNLNLKHRPLGAAISILKRMPFSFAP